MDLLASVVFDKIEISYLYDATASMMANPLGSHFRGSRSKKCLMIRTTGKKALESAFPQLPTFGKSVEPLRKILIH